MSQAKFKIQAMKNLTFSLEAGTLIFPNDEEAYRTQTLIIRKDVERAI